MDAKKIALKCQEAENQLFVGFAKKPYQIGTQDLDAIGQNIFFRLKDGKQNE